MAHSGGRFDTSLQAREYTDELSTRALISDLTTRELIDELSDRLERRGRVLFVCIKCHLDIGPKEKGQACPKEGIHMEH
ncbi:hypothetical protein DFP72DRAFT_1172773 [Ephemerocybe angulata]|uniref:Uncharacterized protein n=1 Tax=Ephemerocybe angulata TaxID=980116 RepID=A0A8H6M3Z7_9AGAR|nr:hypothetical protein DFP72DRAFT_1172773 [Tulosesus angulatus]